MRRLLAFAAVVCTVVAVACGGGDDPTAPTAASDPAATAPKAVPPPSLATASNGEGLSITTDKDDYQPGDTVRFTGAGWQPGDTLDIVLEDEPATHEPHRWWIPVNEAGGFRDSTYVVDVGDVGVTFTLTASSRGNAAQRLTVQFTDGNPGAPTAGAQTPSPVIPGNTATYTITVAYTGNAQQCTVVLTAAPTVAPAWPAPPPGGFFSFSPASLTAEGGQTRTSTLTVAVPAGTAPNTYRFRITADQSADDSDCQGNDEISADILLSVATPANDPPVLGAIGNQTVAELTQLAFTATATDDNPGLTFSLANPATGTFPTGAMITAAGAFTWTPTEAQGPGTYRVKIVVTDAGSLSDEEEIQIIVTEVNLPPVLAAIGPQTVDEEVELTFTATATDPDLPANTLSFSLQDGTDPVPVGAAIVATSGVFTWTPTEAQGPGVYRFKVRVTDNGVNPANLFDEEEITVTVNEANKPPVLTAIGPRSVNEGSALTFTATANDPDVPANTLTFSLQAGGNPDLASASIGPTTGAFTWTPVDDNPTGTASDNYTLTVRVTDDGVNPANLFDEEAVTVTVNNVPPTITGISLDPNVAGFVYPITGQPKVLATWTDPGTTDTHTCTYSIKDEVLSMVVSTGIACGSPMNVTAAGLYTVTVTVTDDDLGSDSETFPTGGALIVIYDPSAGFVTGGGWINSPAGACKYGACWYLTTGKATFGFVSKYTSQKDKTSPELSGNTEFQFHAGNLNFKSSSYEWLVVNGNSGRAQYKGVGTVNGAANYGFMLTAYDGTIDKFRIKIWDISTGYVIYDNQMNEPDTSTLATELGAGSIIIHVKK